MGRAYILFDADFSQKGLGKVTYSGDSDLQSIVIDGPSQVAAESVNLSVKYYPINTEQKGVTWSIVEGNAYATIDQYGVLTIDQSAYFNDVVVRATSDFKPSVIAQKTINVSYLADNADLWDIARVDSDFHTIMANATKRYQLASPITKDGTTVGTEISNPITSTSQSYVVLFDATFPVQVNTDNPGLFFRLGIGSCLRCQNVNYFYFESKFGQLVDKTKLDFGIPVGQNYRARILLYWNYNANKVTVKNLGNNTMYEQTMPSTASGTLYANFCLGGGAASANNYNGTINEFIVGTL